MNHSPNDSRTFCFLHLGYLVGCVQSPDCSSWIQCCVFVGCHLGSGLTKSFGLPVLRATSLLGGNRVRKLLHRPSARPQASVMQSFFMCALEYSAGTQHTHRKCIFVVYRCQHTPTDVGIREKSIVPIFYGGGKTGPCFCHGGGTIQKKVWAPG